MAAIVTEAQFARTVEIDGQTVGFTTEDLRNARIYANKDGIRGALPKTDLIDWFQNNAPEFDLPEPSEKKRAAKVDDSNEVSAVLNYRVIGKNGSLNKTVHSLEITKGMIRSERKGLRGRPSAENYLAAAASLIEPTMAPFEIVDNNSNVYEVQKTDDGKLSAARSKSGTEAILRTRLSELEEQLAKYEEQLGERTDSE